MTSQPPDLDTLFRAGGLLAGGVADFEDRPQQRQMAAAFAEVIAQGGRLLAEAGTGTGKTLAYLVPAVLSGRRTIVSTGTKTLQDQILEKEVPLLRRLAPALEVVCLKGRSNYLCLLRIEEYSRRPFLAGTPEAAAVLRIEKWAEKTKSGDRAELAWLGDFDPLWNAVAASSETCLGQKCPRLAQCHLFLARRAAEGADLVVVNHHLLLADAAMGAAGVTILPDAETLVIDEAHLLEEIATRSLGRELSTGGMRRFLAELSTVAGTRKGKGLARKAGAGYEVLDLLEKALPPRSGSATLDRRTHAAALELLDRLRALTVELGSRLKEMAADRSELESLATRCAALAEKMSFIHDGGDPSHVYWFERREGTVSLLASPLEVAILLSPLLFGRYRTVLLTSATLAVDGDFGYVRDRLGLGACGELVTGSPFDYRRQAVLYVPRDLMEPNQPGYVDRLLAEIRGLLELTGGRAFVLCTSWRNLEAVHRHLSAGGGFTLFRQGEAPRWKLLEEFRAASRAVLVATTSFWQGVDVPGQALSCVIVDRLPFAAPDDPITAARIARVEERGESAFRTYQLPAAVIMLKQGLGRLIRRASDRGIVAVMDSRILERGYGRTFIRSLPNLPLVRSAVELSAAWDGLREAGGAGEKRSE